MPGPISETHPIELHADVRGEGPPLLLLHGLFGCGGDFAHVFDLDALARKWTVITPDLRGHGRSESQPGPFTHRVCAVDVLALLDRLGFARVRAVGLSLGGNTLLHLATMAPDRVEAMVIVSACDRYPAQARAIMRGVAADTQSESEWQQMRARHARGDVQVRALFDHARAFADDYEDMSFDSAALSRIRARTLVVGSDGDPFYPVSTFVALHHGIADSNLCILPCEGHTPVFGTSRAYFVDVARRFLAE